MATARGGRVDDEGDRARDAVSVGAPFANDVPRAVQELDSVLHARRFRQPSPVASNRFVDADRACLAAVGEQSAGSAPAALLHLVSESPELGALE
jgi:hypothetical protein